MHDKLMGGLLAFGIAAPALIVCCGGGTVLPVAVFGGIGAWLSGLQGISIALALAFAFLVIREVRRAAKRRTTSEIYKTKGPLRDPNE